MKRFLPLLAALLSAMVLAACGTGSSPASSTTHSAAASSSASANSDHNAADVTFAQGMVPHHRQAVDMADLASARAASEEVRSLARTIRSAQDPEITTMTGWLRSWGEPTATPRSGGHGMGMGMPPASSAAMPMMSMMPGMMSADDMAAMTGASGPGFDRMFLTMMITHHEGAISMARAEEQNGRYEPAKELARGIQASQSEEITTMRTLLAKL
ncbi:DUF305 domain-containing protein [Frankia sp. CiP3]|uniref:DUF305 domain-containing protein n=1 Tax=Frankia sp. CiP3 TaxID=2880971 RepID=UPI001EF59D28|nr:DUF305 domain-containing protein [Frankia sp. CiP3]